jgi:hypothetical protein
VFIYRGGIEKNVSVWSSKIEFKKAAVKIKKLDEVENTNRFITSPDETSNTDVKCELCSKSFEEETLYKKHLQKVHKIKNSAIMRIDPDNGDNSEDFVPKKKRGTQRFEYEPDIGDILMEIKTEREDEQSSRQSDSDFAFLSLNAVKSKVNSPPASKNCDEEPLGLFELGSLFQSSSTTYDEESSNDEPSLGFNIQDIIAASSPSTSYSGIKYPCPYPSCNNMLASEMNLARHIRGNHVEIGTLMKSIGASVSKVVQKSESLKSLRLRYNVGTPPSTEENDELNRLPNTSHFGQHRTRAVNVISDLALSVIGNNRRPVKRRQEIIPTVPELDLDSLLSFGVPHAGSMEESPSQ